MPIRQVKWRFQKGVRFVRIEFNRKAKVKTINLGKSDGSS